VPSTTRVRIRAAALAVSTVAVTALVLGGTGASAASRDGYSLQIQTTSHTVSVGQTYTVTMKGRAAASGPYLTLVETANNVTCKATLGAEQGDLLSGKAAQEPAKQLPAGKFDVRTEVTGKSYAIGKHEFCAYLEFTSGNGTVLTLRAVTHVTVG
jgi:hypothetical protein